MTTPEPPRSPFPSRRDLHRDDRHEFADEHLAPAETTDAPPGDDEQATAQWTLAFDQEQSSSQLAMTGHGDGETQPQGEEPRSYPGEYPLQDAPAFNDPLTDPYAEAAAIEPTRVERPAFPGPQAPDAQSLFPSLGAGDTSSGLRSRRLEHERVRARKRKRNRRIRTFFVFLLVFALIGAAGYFALKFIGSPTVTEADDYPGPGHGSAEVTVESGDLGTDIGQKLVNADVVKSVAAFTRAFDANVASSSIRPGTYSLMLQMSASEAVAALLDEANRTDNTVTVNAGQTAAEIEQRMIDVAGFTREDVDAALADTAALGLPEEAGGNIEGWLFPRSYEVSASDTPTSLFTEMIAATVEEMEVLGVPEGERQTLLIKASILEREMNIPEYLPQVARVIENRLDNPEGETRGLLQMDSTVLYGVGKTGGVPTRDDLANDNPYNTYIHKGLPPTPISQPSRAAVEATQNPASGSWLYFVTVNLDTGETLFADTLAQQEESRLKFNTWCDANEGKC